MRDRGAAACALLGATISAAATFGVPHEGMLQDTFKSAVIAGGAFTAALVFFWPGRHRPSLNWNPILLLPLVPCAYAIASMAWSHAWFAGVEAVRWFIVALIAMLALQCSGDARWRQNLAWGIAAGGFGASVWVVLQFIFGLELFPQGARPGSTFVNRNFFAEFAVCTLPFFWYLAVGESGRFRRALVSGAGGVVAVAICMAGARAALVAMGVLGVLAAAKTLGSSLRRNDIEASSRRRPGPSVFGLPALATVIALGFIPATDGTAALSRAFTRAASIASADESATMRLDMWAATVRDIVDHPLTGIGAGAWEHEADFYAHNEFLQFVAEYGLAGWVFLAVLAVWVLRQLRSLDDWRAAAACGLLALGIVSMAGFPWHLAATGAMLGVCIGALASSRTRRIEVPPAVAVVAAAFLLVALMVAAHATWTATRAESRLARAAKIALEIGGTSNPNDPRWSTARSEMLRLVDEGMRLHPAERMMTPIVADELGRWGDWPNAIRIWEHVLKSRPHSAAIARNIARGYAAIGQDDLARQYRERARQMSSSKG